jgi:hypothetical protein
LLTVQSEAANSTRALSTETTRHRVVLVYSSFFMKRFKKTALEGIRAVTIDIRLHCVEEE